MNCKKQIKKTLALTLALMLVLFGFSACGKKEEKQDKSSSKATTESSEQSQTAQIDDITLQGIITSIESDFTATTDAINAELEKVQNAIGDTFSGYEKNVDKFEAFYTFCLDEAKQLYGRTYDNSIKYYKLVASTVDHSDSDAVDSATEDLYDALYEGAYDDLHDEIYEDAFDLLKDDYYEGIINDAKDSMDYGDWLDIRSDFYSDWLDARSDFYSDWLDSRSDFYGDYLDIRSEFLYEDNFDVDKILNTDKKAKAATTKKATTTKKADSGDSVEWKEFLQEYEEWVDSYIELYNKYKDNPSDMSILADYTEQLAKVSTWASKADKVKTELENSPEDLAEYTESLARIAGKLSKAQ